jgi:hypothetical protein
MFGHTAVRGTRPKKGRSSSGWAALEVPGGEMGPGAEHLEQPEVRVVWTETLGRVQRRACLGAASGERERGSEAEMGERQTRVQSERGLQLRDRGVVVAERDVGPAEDRVRARILVVERDRAPGDLVRRADARVGVVAVGERLLEQA